MTSIRRHLFLWLLGALAAGAIVLVAGYYAFAFDEINEVFDKQLKQIALTVVAVRENDGPSSTTLAMSEQLRSRHGYIVQVWTPTGELLFSSVAVPALPLLAVHGFHTVQLNNVPWRVYSLHASHSVVQSAQSVMVRENLANELADKLLFPGLVALPVIAWLLAYGLKLGLRPLEHVAAEVGGRGVLSLQAIPEGSVPIEIRPVIVALNALMLSLASALSRQRQFTADAAHGLRTPLAALSLQFQLLESTTDTATRDEVLSDIHGGLHRATHLVAQLLDLSRVEPGDSGLRAVTLDLAELVRVAVGDFSLRAEQAQLDLGAEAALPMPVSGDPRQLRILIDNLIDNAVRYTEPGGRIDVRVGYDDASREIHLDVVDSGPGLAPEQRSRVFDRFYRVVTTVGEQSPSIGAGLGLAISKEIAERHRATIALGDGLPNADKTRGLMVRVSFPAGHSAT